MKNLDMKAIFRILTLTVVATLFAGTVSATDPVFKIKGASPLGLDWGNPTTMTAEDGKYVYTFTATSPGNLTFAVLKDDVQMMSSVQNMAFDTDYQCNTSNSYNQYNIYCSQGFSYKISVTNSSGGCTIRLSDTTVKYTVNASASPAAGGTCDAASKQCIPGGSVTFTITPNAGYAFSSYTYAGEEASSKVVRDGNTYTVTPNANDQNLVVNFTAETYTVETSLGTGGESVSPASQSGIAYGGNQAFTVTPAEGYYLDKSNNTYYTGTANIAFNGNEITLSNIRSSGTLNIAFVQNQAPVVYWAQYPTVGINTVNLYGYLAERYCHEVNSAGFYWKLTDDITAAEVATAAGGGAGTERIIASDVASPSSLVNGSAFNALNKILAGVNDITVIYLVNYVESCNGSGGTDLGISDRVALYYQPCKGIASVSIDPATIGVPKDSSYVFTAIPREAGKTPTYAWSVGGSPVAGATTNTFKYTMTSTKDDVIVRVTVTDNECQVSKRAETTVSLCSAPSMTLAASKDTPTPWEVVALTVGDLANASSVEWSVTPEAELYDTSISGASFKGGVQSGESTVYTITATAVGNVCTNNVQRTAYTKKITVVKDQEDCTSPTPQN